MRRRRWSAGSLLSTAPCASGSHRQRVRSWATPGCSSLRRQRVAAAVPREGMPVCPISCSEQRRADHRSGVGGRERGGPDSSTPGAWLSWLERSLHTAEVGGSSPPAPTSEMGRERRGGEKGQTAHAPDERATGGMEPATVDGTPPRATGGPAQLGRGRPRSRNTFQPSCRKSKQYDVPTPV